MASFECGRQIKREVQTVDEVPFQRHDVKSEPGEAEMFSKCGRNGDASDTYMSTNDLDENDELKVNMPIDKFDPEEIKIEKICFIPYFDLKSEKCEKAIKEGSNLKECEEESFSHENGSSNSWRNHNESRAILLENITEGSKPSVGFTKVSSKNNEFKVNVPIDKFDPEQIDIEDNFFIPHPDIKFVKCKIRITEGSNKKACEGELFKHENGSIYSWRNHNESHAILLSNMTEDSFTMYVGK
ncbi:uncharacterized protein isoform X4 [Leptinotarsa decemlineata]|uniref:uncharacterized protein isoform X4 n=1 Tax=Leptinotarsa decemlineata TaxID=7539 RepID=UPI003D30B5AC